jgi:hypothetical protein
MTRRAAWLGWRGRWGLPRAYAAMVGKLNTILRETLGVPGRLLLDPRTIPMTTGRLVADALTSWLVSLVPGPDQPAYGLCLAKLGYLDVPDTSGEEYFAARERRCDLLPRARCRQDVYAMAADPCDFRDLKLLLRDPYMTNAVSSCGVGWWAGRARTESCRLNAVVQGGRCNNELPYECRTGPGLDVDLSNCSGSTLRSLTYPVGVPSVLSYKPNDRRPTLGQFLRKWGEELVPGLWQVLVSGILPYGQDLLPSTIVNPGVASPAEDEEDGCKEVNGRFALLRKEVRNGIITHDVLNTLRAVATEAEWSARQELEVVTAAFYKKSDRRERDAWIDAVLAAPYGGARACLALGERPDTRPTLWHGVPLEGFTGALVDERERLKEAAARGDAGAGALQAVIKLLVNTTYGDIASHWFEVGNTVVANNITARARVGVWMLAKALGLRQTITDGGLYTPDRVPHWRGKRMEC